MSRRVFHLFCFAVCLAVPFFALVQEGHPLTGTWSGDWGPTAGQRNHLTIVMIIDIKDAAGTVTNWAIQFGNPLELERSGWKRSTLRIADAVTVDGTPARGTARQVFAKSVVLTRTGKRLFALSAAPRPAAPSAPPPRWPDGQIRLGPSAGKKGYWGTASTKVLVENSAGKIAMNEDGLLLNITDADKVAPFQPWAKAVRISPA